MFTTFLPASPPYQLLQNITGITGVYKYLQEINGEYKYLQVFTEVNGNLRTFIDFFS